MQAKAGPSGIHGVTAALRTAAAGRPGPCVSALSRKKEAWSGRAAPQSSPSSQWHVAGSQRQQDSLPKPCGRRRPERSFSGCRPALAAQEKTMLRTDLRRKVRSPPATQTAAWWLMQNGVTFGTPCVLGRVRHAQPKAKLCYEGCFLKARGARRQRVQECTGAWPRLSWLP